VGTHKTALRDDAGKTIKTLIWGDPVHVVTEQGDETEVRARTVRGFVDTADLTDHGVLEVYVIDVGQGDGILMRTPDDCWHMIDAGRRADAQMTKKGAANFVRWKFIEDLERDKVSLATAVVSHPDLDHFGGFIDVLSGSVPFRGQFDVEVDRFYHSGLGRYAEGPQLGQEDPGEVAEFPEGNKGIRRKDTFYTELLDTADDFANPPHEFLTEFGEFAQLVASVPNEVAAISQRKGYLPGYAPGETDVTIRVLGPILEEFETGEWGLRNLGTNSVTLNRHSVVLRVEYDDVRILLTGYLNTDSQKLLRSYYDDSEFTVDVAKACHHGAEEVDLAFVKAMAARATVISSGDDENYAHPRPVLMGAGGLYGRESRSAKDGGKLMPPLLYSTELARAVKLAYPYRVEIEQSNEIVSPEGFRIRTDKSKAIWKPLESTHVATSSGERIGGKAADAATATANSSVGWRITPTL
jgi:hypothetical protein